MISLTKLIYIVGLTIAISSFAMYTYLIIPEIISTSDYYTDLKNTMFPQEYKSEFEFIEIIKSWPSYKLFYEFYPDATEIVEYYEVGAEIYITATNQTNNTVLSLELAIDTLIIDNQHTDEYYKSIICGSNLPGSLYLSAEDDEILDFIKNTDCLNLEEYMFTGNYLTTGNYLLTPHTNIDPALGNSPLLFDIMHWTNDNGFNDILNDNNEFYNLRHIVNGYGELMIFESEYDYGDHILINTEILLSEYPITIDTTYHDYFYDQNGVMITITHRSTGYTSDYIFDSPQNYPALEFEANSEIRGILHPTCDTLLDCKQDYDSPAQYQYWTDFEEIIITGFLTNEQISALAVAITEHIEP